MEATKIINPAAYARAIKAVNEGRFGYLDSTDYEILGYTVLPIDGFEAQKDYPFCCNYHKQIFENAKERMEVFPLCCDAHKRLVGESWFNKADYPEIPKKVMDTIAYTEYHFYKQIGLENWYEDITQYLEYCLLSFGQLPTGYGPPVGLEFYYNNIIHWLNQNKTIPAEKKVRLQKYLADYGNVKAKAELPDINILMDTYNRWLKVFPFSISYFRNAKETFKASFPLFKEKPLPNKYTGTSKVEICSKSELIDFLINTTKQLLQKINSPELVQELSITDRTKHTLELLNEDHRIKTESLFGEYSMGEKKYIQILKSWLTYQKDYFKEFTTLVNNQANTTEPKSENDNSQKLDEIINSENKFLKGIPMEAVVNHFKILTERKSKNGKPYLTPEQLINFLKRGFLADAKKEKQKINFAIGEKGFVIKRFYEFFDLAVSQYCELNKKHKYIKLVTNCFDNWDAKGVESFFKPNKTKENW